MATSRKGLDFFFSFFESGASTITKQFLLRGNWTLQQLGLCKERFGAEFEDVFGVSFAVLLFPLFRSININTLSAPNKTLLHLKRERHA
jgi:hypothetical protein